MKKENIGSMRIIPLGGLEKIGMNITAFEYEDSIIVVDCGLAFPEDGMLGIDLVIPDVTYLKNNIEKVKGFVITHGHEDHIGALSYILREINIPIYATKLTMGIIEKKLTEHNLLRSTRRKVVKHGQSSLQFWLTLFQPVHLTVSKTLPVTLLLSQTVFIMSIKSAAAFLICSNLSRLDLKTVHRLFSLSSLHMHLYMYF